MTCTSIHCGLSDPAPIAKVSRNDDGDVWLEFSEGNYQTEMRVVLSPEQFLAFVGKCEGMRDGIELAIAAEAFNEA